MPCLLQRIREHSQSHVTPCCDLIGECCHDLLCLSLLLPGNPQVGGCDEGVIVGVYVEYLELCQEKTTTSATTRTEFK